MALFTLVLPLTKQNTNAISRLAVCVKYVALLNGIADKSDSP